MEKVIQEKIPSGGFFIFAKGGFFLTGHWADRHTPALSGGVVVPPFGGDTPRAWGRRMGDGDFFLPFAKTRGIPGPPVSRSARREEGNLSLGDGKIVEVVEVREKVSRFSYSPLRQPMEGGWYETNLSKHKKSWVRRRVGDGPGGGTGDGGLLPCKKSTILCYSSLFSSLKQ